MILRGFAAFNDMYRDGQRDVAQYNRDPFNDEKIEVLKGAIIGDYVKIYQGVTIGALSTRGGQSLKGVKRHPTIEDRVTIYAGASILGGETVIGHDAIIGSNTFITSSVEPEARVSFRDRKCEERDDSLSDYGRL